MEAITIEPISEIAEALLKRLICTPSISGSEENTARHIENALRQYDIPCHRKNHNIWAYNLYFDEALPTILLNSHHDTVSPNQSYTRNPFEAAEEDGKIFGLGSNDAGASLVGLWAAFVYFYAKRLKYNLVFSATAEEEISGENGIRSILENLGHIDFAIVGEPTRMNLAIAEKGLLVLDCLANGTPSHAAHPNEDNSIYKAVRDIERIRKFQFPKKSEVLGEVKSTVTIINAGKAHNVVPDRTAFTIDVRTNEHYSNEEIVEIFRALLESEVQPRSLRLNSSFIEKNHTVVQAAQREGCQLFGSPTISDQALMPFSSVKIGIGDSLRSHTADEYIFKKELKDGIRKYIEILSHLLLEDGNLNY